MSIFDVIEDNDKIRYEDLERCGFSEEMSVMDAYSCEEIRGKPHFITTVAWREQNPQPQNPFISKAKDYWQICVVLENDGNYRMIADRILQYLAISGNLDSGPKSRGIFLKLVDNMVLKSRCELYAFIDLLKGELEKVGCVDVEFGYNYRKR